MAPLRNRSSLSNRAPHLPFASSEVEKPTTQRILLKPFALSLSKPVLRVRLENQG
jgi:hypothetical protein